MTGYMVRTRDRAKGVVRIVPGYNDVNLLSCEDGVPQILRRSRIACGDERCRFDSHIVRRFIMVLTLVEQVRKGNLVVPGSSNGSNALIADSLVTRTETIDSDNDE